MGYDIRLNIPDDSPQAKNIAELAMRDHISREEAALRLLAASRGESSLESARSFVGAFASPDDAAILDDALKLAMEDRERRNLRNDHG
jgi:hypothetical protein